MRHCSYGDEEKPRYYPQLLLYHLDKNASIVKNQHLQIEDIAFQPCSIGRLPAVEKKVAVIQIEDILQQTASHWMNRRF